MYAILILKFHFTEKIMQIYLNLQANNPLIIPLNYHYQLQSAIYSKLFEISASDFWHNYRFGNKRKFKSFVFGPLLGKYSISGKQICFENDISLEIRSPIFEFCDKFQRSMKGNPIIKLFDTTIDATSANITNKL